jgi:serine/threonine protein kinase
MPDAAMHPSARELFAFSQGQLSEAAARTVANHLEACSSCRAAVPRSPSDSFPRTAGSAKPGSSSLPPGKTAAWGGGPPPLPPKPPATTVASLDLPPELANQGKYRILRELGRGGMGVVYQAQHTVMDRTVALKVINPSVLAHPDALPRFQGEVRAAARLDHEHIVRAHDAEQMGNLHLLVMEFVEGMSLSELVQQKGPLPVPHACHYARQAALGLQHAFEQGMVHRDVKPQNLMVTPRGTVKILDFGLARMRSERGPSGGLTEVGSFMGTADYVSPEQATDARNADVRADTYSLGCTLYFLLTGRPPFVEDTAVKLVLAHIEKEARPLHEVRPDVPRDLSALVARMLAKDPAQRFQTPIEVAQALVAFTKPGSKPSMGAVPPPLPDVGAPGTRTAISGDTSKFKEPKPISISQPPAPKPVEKAVPPYPEWLEAVPDAPRKATKAPEPPAAARAAWYRRGLILAGLGVALLALGGGFLAAMIFKDKEKTADEKAKARPNEVRLDPIEQALAALAKPPEQEKDPVPPEGPPKTREGEKPKEPPETIDKGTPPEQPAAKDVPNPPMPMVKAPDPSPAIRNRLEQAKADYQAKMDKHRKALREGLDKAEKGALLAEDKELLAKVKKERTAFEKSGVMPTTVSIRKYLKERLGPRKDLIDAYNAAARDYRNAKHDDNAEAVQNEREGFERREPPDNFLAGTVWKGPTEFAPPGAGNNEATLTVLEREGRCFKAELMFPRNCWEVEGTVEGNLVRWQAAKVKALLGEALGDHVGPLSETSLDLEGKWTRAADKKTIRKITHLKLE